MASKSLFSSSDKAEWNKVLKNYGTVFKLFCEKKNKKDLLKLDNW